MKKLWLYAMLLLGTVACSEKDSKNEIITIPDREFKSYLLYYYDDNGDREISVGEAAKIEKIKIENNKNLLSLEGVQHLHNLKSLTVTWCGLTSLDIGGCSALEEIDCSNNKLEALDISKNTNLITAVFRNNYIKDLDIQKNTQLKKLYLWSNQLGASFAPKSVSLETLTCDYNGIRNLDLNGCPNLKELCCRGNSMDEIHIDKCMQLETLYFDNNYIKILDLSKHLNLKYFNCTAPGLLEELWLSREQNATIHITVHTTIKYVD